MGNRTWLGGSLTPGVNVDKLNIAAGLRMAATVGYGSARDQMVVTYALQRWARGEEDGADRTWQSEFPRDMTSWRMILSEAMSQAESERLNQVCTICGWLQAEPGASVCSASHGYRWTGDQDVPQTVAGRRPKQLG